MRDLAVGMTPIKQADPELVRALGRIGSNLNQTAKHANIKKELDETFKTIGEEFKKIRENPFLKFFNSLTKEQQQKLLNKFKDELGN